MQWLSVELHLGPEKVTARAALTQTPLTTRSPWVITLPAGSEGEIFSGVARWQSERAALDHWSDVQCRARP
ncbi:MAG: hypothetical protein LBK73_09635 [Treponema sp.]|nr:hypothetical protein [Treponema sp.]